MIRLTILLIFVLSAPAFAQEFTLDFGAEAGLTSKTIQLFGIITILSLAPGIAMMVTCFPFILTVLSILRQAIGLTQSPPNMLIVSLALFLTYFVMEPVFQESWHNGISPMIDGTQSTEVSIEKTAAPFRLFMENRVDQDTLAEIRKLRPDIPSETPSFSVLIPAFMISEITRAFQIGFLVYLPFLIIDLVVSAVLMSMGMMMVSPAMISLPFKLAFFVVADGWTLVAGSLVRGYLGST